jgi:hypothetical protein
MIKKIIELLFAVPVEGDDIINKTPSFRTTKGDNLDFNSTFQSIYLELKKK